MNRLRESWLVIVLALAFGAGLAAVHETLSPIIAENLRADTLDRIPALVPGAVRGEPEEREGRILYRAVSETGETVGWAVPESGAGFADRIHALVGLDVSLDTITGLAILRQSETPGLGDRIRSDGFRNRFTNRPAAVRLRVVGLPSDAEDEVEGVTGATVSSQCVVDIVNRAAARIRADGHPGEAAP